MYGPVLLGHFLKEDASQRQTLLDPAQTILAWRLGGGQGARNREAGYDGDALSIPIIGHRGCPPEAPENSLAGVRKAFELGADGVEIDVWRALDGASVVFHDWSLRRMTGVPGAVQLTPYLLLRRLHLQGSDERIPLLSDALDALPEDKFVIIELKDVRAASRTLRAVRARDLAGRLAIWSSHEGVLRFFAQYASEIDTGLLRDDIDPEGLQRYLDDAAGCGARHISPHWEAVTSQFVAEAHERGFKVYSLTRDLETVAKKAGFGLDGLITDYPREVRESLVGAGDG